MVGYGRREILNRAELCVIYGFASSGVCGMLYVRRTARSIMLDILPSFRVPCFGSVLLGRYFEQRFGVETWMQGYAQSYGAGLGFVVQVRISTTFGPSGMVGGYMYTANNSVC